MAKVEVNHSKYEGIRFDIDSEDVILVDILETIPYEYVGKDTEIVIPTDEFTSVCPWSGLPDFAEIKLTFIPNEHLVEMKSLKYYLTSYRNVGIYQEHATNRIMEDLVNLIKPKYLKIEALWNARGGLGTEVVCEYREEDKEEA
ncbi:preQ(1) synthase [Desertibacillus haloalkaliphilus]|uniref:preQ(1) synthase n=1 Tax=Desertibacillus haloalkaliphilus TaxID=1328930 RepID=UPI001C2652EB|nr:preQ(1) synthase [Desertibacillus haloalkaliphilus]MBU8905230.1 preQ(1) synthase [Desertibacillus haloalkaliphilus]